MALFVLAPPGALCAAWFTFLLVCRITLFGKRGTIQSGGRHWEACPVIIQELLLSSNFNVVFIVFGVSTTLGFETIVRGELKYPYQVFTGVAGLLQGIILRPKISGASPNRLFLEGPNGDPHLEEPSLP